MILRASNNVVDQYYVDLVQLALQIEVNLIETLI
ncbi:hypothetical protein AAKU64_001629 [Undibacterium sp. GrIS 1.8]